MTVGAIHSGELLDRTVHEVVDQHLADLLGRLIAADSQTPPGDCRAAVRACAAWLDAERMTYEIVADDERLPNLIVRLGDARRGDELCWNAHLDTVRAGDREAWRTDPFKATFADGRVYGLGAANCKASAAAQLCAALALARARAPLRGELVLTLVADEESLGSRGTGHLIETGRVRPRYFLAGGPTGNRLIHSERGLLWAEVAVSGSAAHGAVPEEGRNAVVESARLMLELVETLGPALAERRGPEVPPSSLNVGVVRGGESPNMVPPSCSFVVDRRLVPGETPDAALAEIAELCGRSAARRGFEVTVSAARAVEPYAADPDSRLSRAVCDACRYVGLDPEVGQSIAISDARFVAHGGVEIVGFGPGDGRASHGPNESVPVAEARDAARVLALSAAALLGAEAP